MPNVVNLHPNSNPWLKGGCHHCPGKSIQMVKTCCHPVVARAAATRVISVMARALMLSNKKTLWLHHRRGRWGEECHSQGPTPLMTTINLSSLCELRNLSAASLFTFQILDHLQEKLLTTASLPTVQILDHLPEKLGNNVWRQQERGQPSAGRLKTFEISIKYCILSVTAAYQYT